MGKTIEALAPSRGHQVVSIFDGSAAFESRGADMAIEFSTPESSKNNVLMCLEHHLPVVCGTTGWGSSLSEVNAAFNHSKIGWVYDTNFSIGVQIAFKLNAHLAKIMEKLPDYKPAIDEVHHTEKKDKPSGTAISLAKGLIDHHSRFKRWDASPSQVAIPDVSVPIRSYRSPGMCGTHTVSYENEIDLLEIKHHAKSRIGFAFGALLAAEWLLGKKGSFSMVDVLDL